MNRHERRKKRAQERKARRSGDTMGASYQLGGIPEEVLNHPSFKQGEAAGREGKGFSKEYHEQIWRAAELIGQWAKLHPSAELRWVKDRDQSTFVAAALCDVYDWLADSPDATELLRWLDGETGKVLSLNQATWALRLCRALPMPDGSYYGVEEKVKSAGLKMLETFAYKRGTDTRIAQSACGHCGEMLDGASGELGIAPKPGDISICIRCCGFNQFDEELRLVRFTEEELEGIEETTRERMLEARSILRQHRMKMDLGKGSKTVAEA